MTFQSSRQFVSFRLTWIVVGFIRPDSIIFKSITQFPLAIFLGLGYLLFFLRSCSSNDLNDAARCTQLAHFKPLFTFFPARLGLPQPIPLLSHRWSSHVPCTNNNFRKFCFSSLSLDISLSYGVLIFPLVRGRNKSAKPRKNVIVSYIVNRLI